MSVNLTTPGTTPQRRSQLAYRSKALFEFRPSDLAFTLTDDGAGADVTKFTASSGQYGYFSRGSTGYYVTRGGLLAPAFTNFPAFSYNLENAEAGLLLQAARTNVGPGHDISGGSWSDGGTPTVTAVTGPGPNFTGYNISDNDAGANEYRIHAITFTGDAVKAIAVAIRKSTAAAWACTLRDTSAAADRLAATGTWSGTNPGTPTMATGTYLGKVQLYDYWILLFQTSSVTAANTNQLWLYGAGSTASATGATDWAAPCAWNATVPGMLQTASLAQSADVLYFEFKAPPQEMTGYYRFIERGTYLTNLARISHIGLTNDSTDPRLTLVGTGTVYAMGHDNGTTDDSSALSAGPSIGDLVELRAELNTDGSVRLHQSLNEATETSAAASGAITLGTTWGGASTARIYLSSDPAGGNLGLNNFIAAAWLPGTGYTMAQLRARFA